MINNWQDTARAFSGFPAHYSPAPLWYWNDDLVEAEIARQLRELKKRHVMQIMTFPMAGLNVPFLSPRYFAALKFTVARAAKLGMQVWIYDEYCWPSGCAGGLIQRDYPQCLMTACRFYKYPVAVGAARPVRRILPRGQVLWAEAVRADGRARVNLKDYLDGVELRWPAPAGAWEIVLAVIVRVDMELDCCTMARWTASAPGYLDTLNRAAVARYLDLVYESHYRELKEYFGRTVRGFFNDEPSMCYDARIRGAQGRILIAGLGDGNYPQSLAYADDPDLYGYYGSRPWTRDLLNLFREDYGYDLAPRLPELSRGPAADRRVCYHYYRLINRLFETNYYRQIGQWCARHGVAWTGHVSEHVGGGDIHNQIKNMQIPGMDNTNGLDYVLKGDLLTLPKIVATTARITGAKRALAEVYACQPWDYTLAEKIRDADILSVQGINLISSIDFPYSIRSVRKHTANAPGFFQSPLWAYQKDFSGHTARACQMAALGRPLAATAILFSGAAEQFLYYVDFDAARRQYKEVKDAYLALQDAQADADILYESALAAGRVRAGRIIIGGAAYTTVILPATPILLRTTAVKLVRFVKAGGCLVVLGAWPKNDPEGRGLSALWRPVLGGRPERLPGTDARSWLYGKGRALVIAGSDKAVVSSRGFDGDEPSGLFSARRTGGWKTGFGQTFPVVLEVDLGEIRRLHSINFIMEAIKAEVAYDYELQVSPNRRDWETAATCRQRKGRLHAVSLADAPGRYLRWHVTAGGGRIMALEAIELFYKSPDGGLIRWLPPAVPARRPWTDHLSRQPDRLCFYEDRRPARHLYRQERLFQGARICLAMNVTGQEKSLAGQVASAGGVESWDLDSGQIRRVGLDGARRFAVTFAPWQMRVFVIGRRDGLPRRGINLDGRRKVVAEFKGPYRFRPLRENALPLAAVPLRMADPRFPRQWYQSESGRIPEELRFVPAIRFEAKFKAACLTGRERLLFEEGILSAFSVNGRSLTAAPVRDRYYDAFGMALTIGQYLRRGVNVIAGIYSPELFERTAAGGMYRYPAVQPSLDAFVLGDFSVARDAVIAAPVRRLAAGPWAGQGYPYYAGGGLYVLEFRVQRAAGPLWLEVDAAQNVVEASLNGKRLGCCLTWPFRLEVGKTIRPGANRLEVRVTNALGALFRAQKTAGALVRGKAAYQAGLHAVRLVSSL